MEKKRTRTYDKGYKVETVKLGREIGCKKAALELGIPSGTLSSWLNDARKGTIDTGVGTQSPETAMTQASEIQRLRAEVKAQAKEIKRLQEVNEFLEEASAFFAASRQKLAKKSDSNS
jgi:transposase